jgi:photosystem II stability/assembly factor-like uncharacterized protein
MKNYMVIILFLTSLNSYSQWTFVTPPAGSLNFYSVYAINANAVAVAGDQRVIRSINGGASWTTPLTITNAFIYEVHSPEPTHWYALTSNTTWYIEMANPSGITASTGKPDSILSLHFITGACGIAVGYAGKIEATCDTGTTWQLRSSGTTSNLNAIWFANAATGCACGNNGAITCTQNSGATWDTVSAPVTLTLNAIHFPTASIGYIAGDAGTFLKTTDGGATWTSIPAGVPNNLNGVFFIDADTGYVAGTNGLIMKTIDGGTSWNTMNTPTSQTLNSIHFASSTTGWAVGSNATILKYGDFSTGFSENILSADVFVYPNPSTGIFDISIPGPDLEISIEILNSLGEKVFVKPQIASGKQETTVDLTHESKGIYLAHIITSKGDITKKIILE